ncbi:MAG TPA: hypothetical protein VFG63_09560 [Nocardioidaceae bacterium]|nr:hypothetical protein [Nocardioidaceae bacterium]
MLFMSAREFTDDTAWDAPLDLAEFGEPATVRLHWTDAPYVWHVNDGAEVFVLLDGDEHVAHPRGAALVEATC